MNRDPMYWMSVRPRDVDGHADDDHVGEGREDDDQAKDGNVTDHGDLTTELVDKPSDNEGGRDLGQVVCSRD